METVDVRDPKSLAQALGLADAEDFSKEWNAVERAMIGSAIAFGASRGSWSFRPNGMGCPGIFVDETGRARADFPEDAAADSAAARRRRFGELAVGFVLDRLAAEAPKTTAALAEAARKGLRVRIGEMHLPMRPEEGFVGELSPCSRSAAALLALCERCENVPGWLVSALREADPIEAAKAKRGI